MGIRTNYPLFGLFMDNLGEGSGKHSFALGQALLLGSTLCNVEDERLEQDHSNKLKPTTAAHVGQDDGC